MEQSVKMMVSVIITFLITIIMTCFVGIFLGISASRIELDRILSSIENTDNRDELVMRLNDRSDLSIETKSVGDKHKYYVELTYGYKFFGGHNNEVKIKGFTKVLEG